MNIKYINDNTRSGEFEIINNIKGILHAHVIYYIRELMRFKFPNKLAFREYEAKENRHSVSVLSQHVGT